MEQNKGFWYADWSFPIFVGLLSSGVFAGTHMYYLYGIGAFNEVAFVAMLKAGIDTGFTARWRRSARASCSPALSKGRWWYSRHRRRHPDRRGPRRSGAAAGRGHHVPGDQLHCRADYRPGDWSGDWLRHHPGA